MILAEARRGAVDGAWLSNFPFRLPHVLAGHSGLGRGRPQFALHLMEVTATFEFALPGRYGALEEPDAEAARSQTPAGGTAFPGHIPSGRSNAAVA